MVFCDSAVPARTASQQVKVFPSQLLSLCLCTPQWAWLSSSLEVSAGVLGVGKGLGGRHRESAYRAASTWLTREEQPQPNNEKLCVQRETGGWDLLRAMWPEGFSGPSEQQEHGVAMLELS